MDRPFCPPARLRRENAFASGAVENPAYWRIVHGWVVYIVGYGPRRYGAIPGYVPRRASPARSASVYSAFTSIPSGVSQTGPRPAGASPGAAGPSRATVEKSGII